MTLAEHAPKGTSVPRATPLTAMRLRQLRASSTAASSGRTARARLVIASASLAALALGMAGYLLDVAALRVPCFLVVCFIGLGAAPLHRAAHLDLPTRIGLSILISFLFLILAGMAMAQAAWWHPAPVFAVAAAAAGVLHVDGLRRARADRSRASAPAEVGTVARSLRSRLLAPSPICALLGTALWLPSALVSGHVAPGIGGFLPEVPVTWYLGLALLIVAVLTSRHDVEYEVLAAVTLLTLALTVTPALVYDLPRASSAAKHVGIIEQIRVEHRLYPSRNIYNGWPGFFAALAWVCDVIGVNDPMRLATFWPPLIGLFRLAMLRYLFGKVLRSGYRCWVAIALAVLADAIGADYFSPQSVGFLLALALYALALTPVRAHPRSAGLPRLALLLAGGCALAVTHQLSPYLAGSALIVLVAFRVVRPWYVPVLVVVPAGVWALLHASLVSGFLSLSDLGNPSNFHPPPTSGSVGLSRLPVVPGSVVALLSGVGLIAAVGVLTLWRGRSDRRLWAFAGCAAAGLVNVAINPYGNEGVFRVMLFAIPWMALLASGFYVHAERVEVEALGISLALLLTSFNVAMFALDGSTIIRPTDLAAFRLVESTARPGTSLLSLGEGDLPSSPTDRYPLVTNLSRTDIKSPVMQEAHFNAPDEVIKITERYLTHTGTTAADRLYVIWSPVSSYYDWEYGIQLPEQFAQLRDAFLASPYWRPVLARDGTYLFRLVRIP